MKKFRFYVFLFILFLFVFFINNISYAETSSNIIDFYYNDTSYSVPVFYNGEVAEIKDKYFILNLNNNFYFFQSFNSSKIYLKFNGSKIYFYDNTSMNTGVSVSIYVYDNTLNTPSFVNYSKSNNLDVGVTVSTDNVIQVCSVGCSLYTINTSNDYSLFCSGRNINERRVKDLVSVLDEQLYNSFNISNINSMYDEVYYFKDFSDNSYKVICFTGTYGFSSSFSSSYFGIDGYAWTDIPIVIYTIYQDDNVDFFVDYNISFRDTGPQGKSWNLLTNNNCFNPFSYIYCSKGRYKIKWNNFFMKVSPVEPEVVINNNLIIDNNNYIVISPYDLFLGDMIADCTLKLTWINDNDTLSYITFNLNNYYVSSLNLYKIPYDDFNNSLLDGINYDLYFCIYDLNNLYYEYRNLSFIWDGYNTFVDNSGSNENEGDNAIINGLNDINNSIQEQKQVSLNIFESIGNVLSFINPTSENFFAYKLLELLGNLLKDLFVPSEEFITDWVQDMNNWLGQRFGILYFPEEIVIDFLTRIGQLQESNTAIIHVPSFSIIFMGYNATFINEFSYDLFDILDNSTFSNIHSVYLVFVDVILWLGLVVLAYNTFVSVFGGRYNDEIVRDSEKAYMNYQNKKSSEQKSNFIGFRK